MSGYEGDDIYCDVIIPRKVEITVVKETDNVLAFYHTKPHWPVHIVVTCKKHVPSLIELTDELANELLVVVKEIAKQVKDKHSACRVLTNLGGYQDSKHLHIHISNGPSIEE
jgi:histidine triad (HIT) family protein